MLSIKRELPPLGKTHYTHVHVSCTDRKYDLVIYGATGFTGRLATLYIANQYGNKSFKWAIAGRRKDACKLHNRIHCL